MSTYARPHHDRPDLVRLARNCWVGRDLQHDLAARCAAVLASSAEPSVVAVTTAGRLHQLWLPHLPERIDVATIEPDTAARAMTWTRRPEIVAHRLQLEERDITSVDGVRVTTIERTWRDLARVLQLADLVAAGDSALRAGADLLSMRGVLDRCRRGRNIRRARTALALLDARSRSRPESHLRVAISRPGVPRFQVNEAVYRDEGGWLAEPDLSLAEAKIALEYQGSDHAKVVRMRKDITRATDLRANGWLCLPYGPAEVYNRPWAVACEVVAAIRVRAPQLLPPSQRPRSRAHVGARVGA